MAFLSNVRQDLYAALLEFIGTTLFLTLGLGGIQAAAYSDQAQTDSRNIVNTIANIPQLLYIAVSMGLALLTSAWLFFRITGAVFNPAISLALVLVGAIRPLRFLLYVIAQLAGGIAATAILLGLLPGPISFSCAPGPGVTHAQATLIELLLTAALVFTVLMLAVEKHKSTALAPIGIGLTLFVGHLWGVAYTGAGMNPARAFGPAVFVGFLHSHWVYWVGPLSGSLLATGLYSRLKHIEYWNLNPGQDDTEKGISSQNPVPEFKRRMSDVGDTSGKLTGGMSQPMSLSSKAKESAHWNEALPPVRSLSP